MSTFTTEFLIIAAGGESVLEQLEPDLPAGYAAPENAGIVPEVDGAGSTETPTLPQQAGRLALQETVPAPPAELGPTVGVDDFEEIYARFWSPITHFLGRLVGNPDEASDLAQDVFFKAYRAFSNGAEIVQGALPSWLFRIARNAATDMLRHRRLIHWTPLSAFDGDRDTGAGLPDSSPAYRSQASRASVNATFTSRDSGFEDRLADQEIIGRALDSLPDNDLRALLLCEHEGRSVAEVAELLRITPSALKMRLMRARAHFIASYKREGGEIPRP